jgi:hypothetical protein
MKHLFLFFLIVNQSLFAQQASSAGIYRARFFIDKTLTNKVLVSTSGSQNNFSESLFCMPLNYIDSIKQIVEQGVGKELYAVAKCEYLKKENGKLKTTYNSGQYVGDLPKGCKKKAILAFEKDLYVCLRIRINAFRGVQIGGANLNYSKVRPYVFIRLKAFDETRKKIYSKKMRIYDFEKLESVQYTLGSVSVRNSEIITPDQICAMLKKTFSKMSEKK